MVLTRAQRARMMARRSEVDGTDRLSELPDSLIYHIFSLIDTKYMVTSCVLSKRFQFFWLSLRIFQFHEENYRSYYFFVNFIKQVLSRWHGLRIFSFDLQFRSWVEPSLLTSVLRNVLLHEPQHLNLRLGVDDQMNPMAKSRYLKSLFSHQSFETLDAPSSMCNPSFSFNFPIITTLYLDSPFFHDPSGILEPFVRCPNLKDLALHSLLTDLNVLRIEGEKLEKLFISVMRQGTEVDIVVKAPKLHIFKYFGFASVKFLANVPSLEAADLNCFFINDGHWEEIVFNVCKIIQEFQHSKYMKLNECIMEVLIGYAVPPQQFPFPLHLSNLKLLEFGFISKDQYLIDVISYLLRNSPAECLVGNNLWKEIMDACNRRQEKTFLIDEHPHGLKVIFDSMMTVQVKVDFQLTYGWNNMFRPIGFAGR